MDATTEKSCLEEISTLIFDSLEKVTLKTISNNWSITNDASKEVLIKWLEKNIKKTKEMSKEFLIRGYNTKGVYSFSIVTEDKKDVLEKKWKNFAAWLYSIKMTSHSRKLDLPDYEPIKVKNILLTPKEPRDLHIPVISIPAVVKEEPLTNKKNLKTPFSVIKPAVKPEPKAELKMEVKSPIVVKSPEEEAPLKAEKEAPLKAEKSSPEEGKINSKAPAAKKGQLKNQKPVQKGSISSFFNNKPGTSKAAVEKPKPAPVKPKVEAMLIDEDSEEEEEVKKPIKRQATPEKPAAKKEETSKKKAGKKIKLKESNKRSRIRVMQDSSDEEEEKQNDSDEPDTKFIKFDREFTPERQVTQAQKESPEKEAEVEKVKRKAKRWVKKRFQTDDGFMRTENVLEEYSASDGEAENDENKKKNSPPKEKAVKKKEVVEKKSAEKKSEDKKSAEKKKQPTPKPAQASKITSFFTKK